MYTLFLILATALLAATSPPPAGLHIDHVPIAVRDLASTVAQFREMGFTIKPGRPHQNGIENASIKFADGSYIELITAHNGRDSIAKQYEENLKKGQGASYVFLRDSDGTFADQVRRSGGRREAAGPFAFTELPESWHVPHLQLIQYLAPAQDSAEIYQHANGALRVAAVWMFVDRSDDSMAHELGADPAITNNFAFDDRATRSVRLGERTLLLLTPRRAADPPHVLAPAILIEVESLTRRDRSPGCRAALRADRSFGYRRRKCTECGWDLWSARPGLTNS